MKENGITAASSTSTSSSSSEEEEQAEEEEEEFSFYRFSVLRFQGNATHTHITQRLREPLLQHGDEGDALVRRGRRKASEELWGEGKCLIASAFAGLSYRLVPHTAFYGRPAGTDVSRNAHKGSQARLS